MRIEVSPKIHYRLYRDPGFSIMYSVYFSVSLTELPLWLAMPLSKSTQNMPLHTFTNVEHVIYTTFLNHPRQSLSGAKDTHRIIDHVQLKASIKDIDIASALFF